MHYELCIALSIVHYELCIVKMKYYIIVGEASGDLHASRLMRSLRAVDGDAEFRFFGGDLMSAVGGTRVKHYRELAYMGFVPVLLHLRTIFSNMALCVAGNADMETVLKIADEVLKEQKPKKVESFFEPESEGVSKDYVEQEFPVAVPLFNLGFKENGSKKLSDEEAALNEIVMTMLFSSNGKLYTQLLDAELINSSFCYEFSEGPGYAVTILSGESREPEKVAKMIKDYIEKVKSEGFEKEDFEIAKKTVYGDLIGSFNSPAFIGNALMDCALFGGNLFNYANAVANADMDGAKKRLDNMLMTDRSVLSVIVPQKQ